MGIRRFGYVSLAIVALLASAVTSACMESEQKAVFSIPLDEGAGLHNEGIIGGTPTGYNSWRGVIMVHGGYFMTCTGTLIHPKVVLSAGHCVKLSGQMGMPSFDFTRTPKQIWIGSGPNGNQRLATAERIVAHPSWKGGLDEGAGDLSLIYLSKAITSLPIHKLRDFPFPENGDKGVVVGYGGSTSSSPPSGSGIHREGETTLLSIQPQLIETGEWANTCQGDSGGPLFTEQNGEWVVTGVTSFGSVGCAESGGSFSVNILAYCSWLNETFNSFVGEDLGLESCTACAATKASEWGQACGEGYAPCPSGTACMMPEGFSHGGVGYCGAECCTLSYADESYCTNIAGGQEKCGIIDGDGKTFCSVECDGDEDCPDGTNCKKKPYTDDKLCIATTAGDGWEPTDDEENGAGEGEAGQVGDQIDGAEDGLGLKNTESSGTGCSLAPAGFSAHTGLLAFALAWLFA